MIWREAAILVALVVGSVGALAAQEAVMPNDCPLQEEAPVELRGVLLRLTFPGPPNYESVVGGDRAEAVYALQLPQPVCRSFEFHVWHVQLLQLVNATDDPWEQFIGAEVQVNGIAHDWETGHYHTPMWIEVNGLRRLSEKQGSGIGTAHNNRLLPARPAAAPGYPARTPRTW